MNISKKDYKKIKVELTWDELKLLIDSLYTLRRKENPKSVRAISILDLTDKLNLILGENKVY